MDIQQNKVMAVLSYIGLLVLIPILQQRNLRTQDIMQTKAWSY